MADEEEKPKYYGEELEEEEKKLYGELAYKNIKKNEYEEASRIWRETTAKNRKFAQESLGRNIEYLDSYFLNYTQKAKEASVYEELLLKKPDEITGETRGDMAKLAKNLPLFDSFTTQKKSLEELIDGLVPANQNSTLEQIASLFTPKPETYSLAIIYPKVFEKYDYREAMYSPQFWEDTQKLLASESGDISMLLDKFRFKLLEVGVADIRENLAPAQPYKINLGVLEAQMDEIQAQRKILAGKRARWKEYYEYYKQKLIDKKTILMEDGIERVAKQAADQKLKDEEEKEKLEEQQSEAGNGAVERIPVPSSPSRAATQAIRELTAAQTSSRERILQAVEMNREAIDWRHPSTIVNRVAGSLKNYFKNLFVKKEVAKKVAGETVVKTGLKGLATKLGLGAISGGVLTAVMFAKDLLTNEKFQEWAKNAFTFGLIYLKGLLTLLASNLIAGVSAVIGGIAGLILGAKAGALIGFAIGGPLGGVLGGILGGTGGFIIGNVLGWQVGSVVSGIFNGIGAGSATSTVAATTTASTVGVNVGTMATGTGIASVGFWSVIVGPATVFTASIFSLIALFAVGAIQGQEVSGGPKITFSVKSEVDKKVLPNDSNSSVKYRVIITSQSDKDIEISAVVKETLQNAQNTNLTLPQNIDSYPAKIAPGEKMVINYQDYPVKDTFNDSDLVFIVTVTSGGETETASSITRIGSPPVNNDRPFGYPTSGRISRFEDNPDHRGTFFSASGSRYWATGGIDIVNVGGTPVYSTTKGTVIYSGFDYGNSIYSEKNCVSPISVVSPFNYCAVGGAVIVQNGNYIVSFLHLRQTGLATGTVAKGQIIGYMYDNPLPTSDTSHLHYQVLLNVANVSFGGEANDSSAPCTPEKILPEIATRKTVTQDGSGPFTCE